MNERKATLTIARPETVTVTIVTDREGYDVLYEALEIAAAHTPDDNDRFAAFRDQLLDQAKDWTEAA